MGTLAETCRNSVLLTKIIKATSPWYLPLVVALLKHSLMALFTEPNRTPRGRRMSAMNATLLRDPRRKRSSQGIRESYRPPIEAYNPITHLPSRKTALLGTRLDRR